MNKPNSIKRKKFDELYESLKNENDVQKNQGIGLELIYFEQKIINKIKDPKLVINLQEEIFELLEELDRKTIMGIEVNDLYKQKEHAVRRRKIRWFKQNQKDFEALQEDVLANPDISINDVKSELILVYQAHLQEIRRIKENEELLGLEAVESAISLQQKSFDKQRTSLHEWLENSPFCFDYPLLFLKKVDKILYNALKDDVFMLAFKIRQFETSDNFTFMKKPSFLMENVSLGGLRNSKKVEGAENLKEVSYANLFDGKIASRTFDGKNDNQLRLIFDEEVEVPSNTYNELKDIDPRENVKKVINLLNTEDEKIYLLILNKFKQDEDSHIINPYVNFNLNDLTKDYINIYLNRDITSQERAELKRLVLRRIEKLIQTKYLFINKENPNKGDIFDFLSDVKFESKPEEDNITFRVRIPDIIHHNLINDQVAYLHRDKLEHLSGLAWELSFLFQKERFAFYLKTNETQITDGNYSRTLGYDELTMIYDFGYKVSKSKVFKETEEALNSLQKNNISVKSYYFERDKFYIEYLELDNSEEKVILKSKSNTLILS